jgi:hypothetical protein
MCIMHFGNNPIKIVFVEKLPHIQENITKKYFQYLKELLLLQNREKGKRKQERIYNYTLPLRFMNT